MWSRLAGKFIIVAQAAVLLGCASEPVSNHQAPQAQMIFWELQSWESGGGRSRLTLWSDGRSEVMVVPEEVFTRNPDRLVPRNGWAIRNGQRGIRFIRSHVFTKEVAKEKIHRAMAAGIHQLKTFKPDYLDGSGTLVGVQIDGKLIETVIPMFLDRRRGSSNYKRFLAVSKVLSEFDRNAYDVRN